MLFQTENEFLFEIADVLFRYEEIMHSKQIITYSILMQ